MKNGTAVGRDHLKAEHLKLGSSNLKVTLRMICERAHASNNYTWKIITCCQNCFRKRRSGLSNVFIIEHLAQRELKKGQRMFTAFIDFKAAFDTIDRWKLLQKMENMGIPEHLIRAVENIY